jgi:hypothetical protein
MIVRLQKLVLLAMAWAVLSLLAQSAFGQSSDQSLPTPVLANEISGKINALDLGDARLTRHFYAFEGTPGDLLITVDSKNLNGDVDVFTAITFRPLIKTSLYANTQTPEVTKGIYLRTRQILILRIEARTPGDEPGTYHIRFGGAFERFSGGIPVAESSNAETEAQPEKTGSNLLTSVGATIPRPVTETIETAESKPEKATEKSEETEAAKKTATQNTASRRTTSRNPRRGATRPAPVKKTPPKKTESAKTKTETETPKTESPKPIEEKPVVTEKAAETKAVEEKSKAKEVAVGARLIIEEKDGTRIDRPMSTVRRVVIEGNMIVIVLKTGRTERIPMSNVARMAIEPQQ